MNTFTTFKQNWLFRDNRSQKNHCPFELKTEQRVRMEKGGVIIPKAPPQRAFNTHTRFHISLLLGLGFLSWILYSRIASEETPDYRIGQTDINRGPPEPQEEFAWTKVNILLLLRPDSVINLGLLDYSYERTGVYSLLWEISMCSARCADGS